MSARFTESIAVHVLEHDDNSTRFEDFCIELFRDVDGIEYARTSKSWDRGSDGVDASPHSGPVPPFICCSLRSDKLAKAVSDTLRILENTTPNVLIICSAQRVSEEAAGKIVEEVQKVVSSEVTVRVNGQERLTQLSIRYPRAMERLYAAELAELRLVFAQESSVPMDEQLTGLRIALTTQLQHDAQRRRDDVIRNLIVSTLATKGSLTLPGMCTQASQVLHLPRPVNATLLRPEIERLKQEGLVVEVASTYSLTTRGREL